MSRIPPRLIQSYISGASIRSKNCLRPVHLSSTSLLRPLHTSQSRRNTATSAPAEETPYVPLRKQIKDEIKRRKATQREKPTRATLESLPDWELTVGIEIHAQLNTPTKLFSSAPNSPSLEPNTHVEPFDLAIPGSLPVFQPPVLIPAIRAALALNCTIHHTSTFDRKHYFHWDQPSGYQLTQFYRPFATDGHITLYPHDGIAPEDGPEVTIGIKQVQMEQDTGKTLTSTEDGVDTHLVDFARAGAPLIEIITHPHIHHPSTAAALVRKIQTLLYEVDACVVGMQSGGLRADVNVSVRRRDGPEELGQRTEIKNLSSHKSIRDAVIAERDRQVGVLESGGVVEAETRGFGIGDTETRLLRAKGGEVDYRYMPDADVPPVVIGEDLVEYLRGTMGVSHDTQITELTDRYGLTTKDAMSLVALEEGARVEYFYDVVASMVWMGVKEAEKPEKGEEAPKWQEKLAAAKRALAEGRWEGPSPPTELDQQRVGRVAANWVLHELGAVAASGEGVKVFDEKEGFMVTAWQMAKLITYVEKGTVTGASGKKVLSLLARMAEENLESGEAKKLAVMRSPRKVGEVIEREGLWFTPLSEEGYAKLLESTREEKIVEEVLKKGDVKGKGKIMYWVGKMMREGGSGVDAKVAEGWIRKAIEEEKVKREGGDGA